jgi:two-component system, NarL family, response regulator DegU
MQNQVAAEKLSRVLIADRHQKMLEGTRGILESLFDVVMMVADETSLFDSLKTVHPDLVVVDLSLPLTEERNVVKKLRKKYPELRIIILSVHDEQTAVDSCLAAGAMGFVLKRSTTNDLIPAVHEVQQGRNFVSPSIDFEL